MNKAFTKTWTKPVPVSLPITAEEMAALGICLDSDGDMRGSMKTYGPWQLPISYKALAMSTVYTPENLQRYSAQQEKTTAYGIRTMNNIHQSGYEIEGQTSIKGRKYRSFSSSQLFELPNGKLANVAIIHVCIKEEA
jgi:hypothetical protein